MRLVFFLGFLFVSMFFGREVNVAAAANLTYVLNEISKQYLSLNPGEKINISYSSSGKAYAQIAQNAPIDLFISADEEYPHKLYIEGKAPQKEQIYAQGILVLWSADSNVKITTLQTLAGKNISHVAIPNPALAPYGRAAKEVLEKTHLYEKISPKLINATSISQAHQFVATKNAQAGFGAYSLIDKNDKSLSYIIVDKKLYSPINQALVVTNYGKDNPKAIKFKDFVLGKQSKKIFEKYGYIVNE